MSDRISPGEGADERPVGLARASLATLLVALVAGLFVASCGNDADDSTSTRLVPQDYSTVQAAVDASHPGDLVLIAPGVYDEAVVVDTDDLVIRGVDRNSVILDGGDRLSNGFNVTASGVAIENLTTRAYQQNGVLINGSYSDYDLDQNAAGGTEPERHAVVGYRVSYVTAYDNGLYGIYAFGSRGGLIEHSMASGHPDSGIYVGQCKPCDVVIRDVVAQHNAIGYYGTNASGGVYIVQSVFRQNRLGMTPNSQDMELLAPQVETVIAGNLVVDNADPDTPAISGGFFGGGIAVGGGTANTIIRNRVSGHTAYGIGLVQLGAYEPQSNVVDGNVLTDNEIDLLYLPGSQVNTSLGNCFTGNTFATSVPEAIETALACPGSDVAVPKTATVKFATPPPGVDYRTIAAPDPQPNMPDAATAPAVPASSTPPVVDLDAIQVPDVP